MKTPLPQLSGISSMATREFLAQAVAAWGLRDGVALRFESVGGVDAARRVHDGERFDLVVLAADALDALCAAGCIAPESVTPIVRSDVVVAVREGAAEPDISSEAALREAVLAAGRVGYSTGPSGRALQALFARWGIAGPMRDRLVLAPPGVAVATLIANNEVDLGFQQHSELIGREGIQVLGAMPPQTEIVTTFSGAIGRSSAHPEAARAVLDFLSSSAVDGARRACGLRAADRAIEEPKEFPG